MRTWEITSDRDHVVILAKWKYGTIYVTILSLLKGTTFVHEQGPVDAIACEPDDENNFVLKATASGKFWDFLQQYRFTKNSLNYKKVAYYSSISVDRLDAQKFRQDMIDKLYLCAISNQRDFYYAEPRWYNNRE